MLNTNKKTIFCVSVFRDRFDPIAHLACSISSNSKFERIDLGTKISFIEDLDEFLVHEINDKYFYNVQYK